MQQIYTKELLYQLFIGKNNKLSSLLLKWSNILKNIDLYNYMISYFAHIDSSNETPVSVLYRIIHNLSEIPKCPVCGENLNFLRWNRGFGTFCSKECRNSIKGKKIIKEKTQNTNLTKFGYNYAALNDKIKEKMYSTNLKRYGTKMPGQNEKIKQKIKKTCILKYGVPYIMQSSIFKEKYKRNSFKKYGTDHPMKSNYIKEKLKKTNLIKYGVENVFKSDCVKEKIMKTCILRYTVTHYIKSDIFKEKRMLFNNNNSILEKYKLNQHRLSTCLKKFGVITNLLLPEVLAKSNSKESIIKAWNTRKKNGTTNTSKIEEDFYLYLQKKFDYNNVQRNYNKDPRYNFYCDFYIIDIDLFIEILAHQSHGKHPYDENNENDLKLLLIWKSKLIDNHPQYNTYIKNWTIRDVQKRNTAILNNLNYLEIFSNKIINAIDALEKYLQQIEKYKVYIYDK